VQINRSSYRHSSANRDLCRSRLNETHFDAWNATSRKRGNLFPRASASLISPWQSLHAEPSPIPAESIVSMPLPPQPRRISSVPTTPPNAKPAAVRTTVRCSSKTPGQEMHPPGAGFSTPGQETHQKSSTKQVPPVRSSGSRPASRALQRCIHSCTHVARGSAYLQTPVGQASDLILWARCHNNYS